MIDIGNFTKISFAFLDNVIVFSADLFLENIFLIFNLLPVLENISAMCFIWDAVLIVIRKISNNIIGINIWKNLGICAKIKCEPLCKGCVLQGKVNPLTGTLADSTKVIDKKHKIKKWLT